MSIEFSEYILIFILFFWGIVVGGALNFRHKDIPPLRIFVSNAILCGAFGVVGGGAVSFFFADGEKIVLMGGGILAACIPGFFSNDEIKSLISYIILQKLKLRHVKKN